MGMFRAELRITSSMNTLAAHKEELILTGINAINCVTNIQNGIS